MVCAQSCKGHVVFQFWCRQAFFFPTLHSVDLGVYYRCMKPFLMNLFSYGCICGCLSLICLDVLCESGWWGVCLEEVDGGGGDPSLAEGQTLLLGIQREVSRFPPQQPHCFNAGKKTSPELNLLAVSESGGLLAGHFFLCSLRDCVLVTFMPDLLMTNKMTYIFTMG